MGTKTMYFKGKVKYCWPYRTNDWGKYATRFYPTPGEHLDKLKELEIKNEWKKDDDGEFLNISCPAQREFRGRILKEAIECFDKDGQPMDVHVGIGDGSDVDLKLDYYDYAIKGMNGKRGHAIKWRGVKVDNLVPMNINIDPTVDPEPVSQGW